MNVESAKLMDASKALVVPFAKEKDMSVNAKRVTEREPLWLRNDAVTAVKGLVQNGGAFNVKVKSEFHLHAQYATVCNTGWHSISRNYAVYSLFV